jgi:GH25 family lysozyme M1 (1,4-beta-N-acetylmuramidase)
MAMIPDVIDLSHYNSVSTLYAAKAAGVLGCIHKCTEGATWKDSMVAERYDLAKKAGMLWGLYHFMRPGDVNAQVYNFLDTAHSVADDNTLFALDYEATGIKLSDVILFLTQLSTLGARSVVLYSGHTLREALNGQSNAAISQYRLWLADYTPPADLPPGFLSYYLWQYTDSAVVPGIAGQVDGSRSNMDAETLAKTWAGRPGSIVEQTDDVQIIVKAKPGITVTVMKQES